MDFDHVSKIGALLSRPFARDLLRLLVIYDDISASEAASRLNLHIKTAQDFLEGMVTQGIAEKKEVFERKRPYFRYTLIAKKIQFSYDLKQLADDRSAGISIDGVKIREKKNADCTFKTSPRGDAISSVIIFTGEGRNRGERRISLTSQQGKFLFHLPFPTEEPRTVRSVQKKAGVDETYTPEILDILRFLGDRNIIELIS